LESFEVQALHYITDARKGSVLTVYLGAIV